MVLSNSSFRSLLPNFHRKAASTRLGSAIIVDFLHRLFVGLAALGTVVCIAMAPETKGKSLEELNAEVESKASREVHLAS